ncbi:MAG: metallophosphoesterase [Candidatus Hydrogenedentes bacterium]|nr:metallophosphoesterase [Candidatus Hydrogenedentota bacterium]
MEQAIYLNADGYCRVLQLTDFHTDVDDALNDRTWQDARAMVSRFRPDLLAVTGDIWCGDDRPGEAQAWMTRDIDLLDSLAVPWAFTWGNHDWGVEDPAWHKQVRLAAMACMPEGDDRGNYRLEIRSRREARPEWDLYFLNSRTWCLESEDLAWFDAEVARTRDARGTDVPAIVYTHIPMQQYEDARVERRIHGLALEDALAWGNDRDRGEVFMRTGNVQAVFVGHSHKNDFYFVEKNVRFDYGRSTGHGGYGGEALAKGGKLLTLHENGKFDVCTVFADGSTWTPAG